MEMQPWYWRSLPLEQRNGSSVFAALFRQSPIASLLESPANSPIKTPQARYSICAGAPRLINGQPQMWTPTVSKILPCLRDLLQRGQMSIPTTLPTSLPFTGGWLGWLGYDLAWEIEQLPYLRDDQLPFPVAFWYEPDCFAVLDHQQQELWLAASSETQLQHLHSALMRSHNSSEGSRNFPSSSCPHVPLSGKSEPPTPIFQTSQADYQAMVLRAKQYIQAGDIFQANLSLRFATRTLIDSWTLYQTLQQINPSPFASYWQTPWGSVVSCSPERLVQLQGSTAQTRPIAGTRPRRSSPEQDQQQAQDLLANAKENAEHVMLVDLERNDLGRVSQWGSVNVNEFLIIESYSHVMHLVSNVMGTLRPECDVITLIQAMFPGGTITGCPKVRCMEIIEELEPVRRSLFYGSCGYLDQRGHLDLNILIRTLLVAPTRAREKEPKASLVWGQVGAGIVADSNPEQEWHESLLKAQAQLMALRGATQPEQC